MNHLRLAICALAISLAGCNSTPTAPDIAGTAVAQLQAIPAADPAKYARDMRNWRNPYLIARKDGIALLDPADSVEIILKPDEVLKRLADLPASAWPYGRIVAVRENSPQNGDDAVAIRKNRGLLAGSLEEAHVVIDWVPSA
jgi:hypothetical protein